MRTRMNRKWSMGMAAAFLMAMTSTLSAQSAAQGGVSGSGLPAAQPGASLGSEPTLDLGSGGGLFVVPEISGWCGTDTTTVVEDNVRMRIHLQLLAAALIASGTGVFPGMIVMKAAALRHWAQLTIDVPPPR